MRVEVIQFVNKRIPITNSMIVVFISSIAGLISAAIIATRK